MIGTLLLSAALATPASADPPPATDPVAVEIARWTRFVETNPAKGELWSQIKGGTLDALARAGRALSDGRGSLALLRLAYAREGAAAGAYLSERTTDETSSLAAFEAEWRRLGPVLTGSPALPPSEADALRPALLRALAEAAGAQVRVYYDASLEYGRSTTPESGLYYLGAAAAQRQWVGFLRSLSTPSAAPPPPLRALEADIEALQRALLSAYRPPASIDRHRDFIIASSTLKEARELAAAGQRYGALLRYLQAAQRVAPLSGAPAGLDRPAIDAALTALAARLFEGATDHSLGRLFVEAARADLAENPEAPTLAAAVVSDVLPLYFAALDPARPAPPRPEPEATVTLVRWPYT